MTRMHAALVALFATSLLPALAAGNPGALEINQDCVAVGCFAGDAPGFPVTIMQPGTYVLTSDLAPPGDSSVNSIEVDVTGVDLDLDNHTVDEAMNHEVFSVEPSVSAKQAAKMMHERGIHRLLVMQGGRLEGIVSALDIARAVSQGGIRRSGLALDPCAPTQSPWIDLS